MTVPTLSDDLTTPEASPADVSRELTRRRVIYTKLFELTPPNADGERISMIEDDLCSIFNAPMQMLADELGLTMRQVTGTVQLCELEIREGVMEGIYRYQFQLFNAMRRAGWIAYKIISRISDRWLYRVRLVANPEELDDLPAIEEALVPTKLVPVKTVELEKAFQCLMDASFKFRGEHFVGNPERILDRRFGDTYDAINTVSALIDAGLAEWCVNQSAGATSERFFLYPPTPQEEQPTIEAPLEVIEALQLNRAQLVKLEQAKMEAERSVRADADRVRAELQTLNERADALAEERVAMTREIKKIDESIQELSEIARLENELAQRKARALKSIKT